MEVPHYHQTILFDTCQLTTSQEDDLLNKTSESPISFTKVTFVEFCGASATSTSQQLNTHLSTFHLLPNQL